MQLHSLGFGKKRFNLFRLHFEAKKIAIFNSEKKSANFAFWCETSEPKHFQFFKTNFNLFNDYHEIFIIIGPISVLIYRYLNRDGADSMRTAS